MQSSRSSSSAECWVVDVWGGWYDQHMGDGQTSRKQSLKGLFLFLEREVGSMSHHLYLSFLVCNNWMWARALRIYHIFKFCSQKPFTILLFETLACWLIAKERYTDLENGFSYWAFEHDYFSLTFSNLHLNYVIANTLFNWRGEGDWITYSS